MIWLIMGISVLAVLLFVAQPFYAKNAPVIEADSEVKDYLAQIKDIDTRLENADKSDGVSALELAKIELQRQVLAKSEIGKDSGPKTVLLSVLLIIFAFGTMGLYATLGRPELTKAAALQKPILSPAQAMVQDTQPDHENAMSLEDAVAGLEKKLAQDDQNPQGWVLYARSLMSMRRFDEAVGAYEKVLVLTDNNPNVQEEFDSAKAYIAQQQDVVGAQASPQAPIKAPIKAPGPSAEQMRDAVAMTPEARQAMINAMVAGLSAKLQDNPNDPDGWVRLLRARKVMGAEAAASSEIAVMRATFQDNPEVIQQILSSAGWAEDTPQ